MGVEPTIILNGLVRREQAHRWVDQAVAGTVVRFGKPRRSLPQNDKLHAAITDVARQVEWPPGSGQKRTVEAWKDIFTAALRSSKHELDVVPGIEGGFVLLGMHTSSMNKAELGELIDLIEAFGASHGVTFSEPSETNGEGGSSLTSAAGSDE